MTFQIFFGVLMIVAGAWMLLHWHKANRTLQAAQAWLSTPGTIVASEVKRGTSRRPTTWLPHVEYRYEAAGRQLTNTAILIGSELATTSRHRAELVCLTYPPGRTIDVFYDPANPSTACLERRREGPPLELFGGVFGLIAGAALLAV